MLTDASKLEKSELHNSLRDLSNKQIIVPIHNGVFAGAALQKKIGSDVLFFPVVEWPIAKHLTLMGCLSKFQIMALHK
jgi:hypothetical protein